jgi:hypothetical protein
MPGAITQPEAARCTGNHWSVHTTINRVAHTQGPIETGGVTAATEAADELARSDYIYLIYLA